MSLSRCCDSGSFRSVGNTLVAAMMKSPEAEVVVVTRKGVVRRWSDGFSRYVSFSWKELEHDFIREERAGFAEN